MYSDRLTIALKSHPGFIADWIFIEVSARQAIKIIYWCFWEYKEKSAPNNWMKLANAMSSNSSKQDPHDRDHVALTLKSDFTKNAF